MVCLMPLCVLSCFAFIALCGATAVHFDSVPWRCDVSCWGHASTNHSMIFLWVSGIKGIGTKPGEKKLVVVVVQDLKLLLLGHRVSGVSIGLALFYDTVITYVCKYVADSLYVHNIYDYFICCLLFCRLPSSNWSNRSFKITTQWPHSQSSESFSLALSTARKDEEKKQPATMLRSSWAFKNSPFFAPETDEGSNRPLRHLAELQCSMSGRDRMAFRSCLDDSKLCSYCIRNRHRHIESFLGNNLKDLCHRTTFKMATKLWSHCKGIWLSLVKVAEQGILRGKKHTRFPTVLHLTSPGGGVCSFEIHLDEIAGLDYWNPLLVDASRVVIEALGDGAESGRTQEGKG